MSLTLDDIRDRCDEVGECWLWRQSRTREGYPRLCVRGLPQYAHHAAWVLSGRPLVPSLRLRRYKCGERLCCNPAHMRYVTRSAVGKAAAEAGAWTCPVRVEKIKQAMRARGKLSMEIAREIRESEDSADQWASRLGVSRSLIFRVRKNQAWVDTGGAVNSSVFSYRPAT